MAREQTYWVDGEQVTKAAYVRAERDAGFHNTQGRPDEPATVYWTGIGSDGQRHHGRLVPFAGGTDRSHPAGPADAENLEALPAERNQP